MLNYSFGTLSVPLVSLVLSIAACNSGGETSSDGTAGTTGGTSGDAATVPTTSGATDNVTGTGTESGGSATGTTSTTGEPTSTTAGTTEGVDTVTDPTGATESTSTTEATTTGGTTEGSTTEGSSTTEGTVGSTTEGSSTTGAGESSGTTDPADCVPTEMVEVTCDLIDNDCDDSVDNVDVGADGICDCLTIGILGSSGFAPNSNFEAWLEDQGSAVTRTLLQNNPGVVTPAFLAQYDLVLVDRIERALSPDEAAALEAFVKDDGRGLITLIGYNFDNLNPAPERDRANSALAPFGLAYTGGYFGDGVIPTFDQNHPISKDIFDVNFAGGIKPTDIGNQGMSTVFATAVGTDAGLAHQTAMDGGRVVVWGDEWITFDSDWQGYADVQAFWVNMVSWAKPKDFCGAPQ